MDKIKDSKVGISFLYTYSFWSIIIFVFVLINYLCFRSIFIKDSSLLFLINSIINYGVFISFFFLLLYKFYHYIFEREFFLSTAGIVFLSSSIIKLYISNVRISIFLDLIFFISTLSIILYILLKLVLTRDLIEYKRGIYVFILITLSASSLHFIFFVLNNILDFSIISFLSYHVGNYTSKVASLFFMLLLMIYIFFAIKEVLSKYVYVASIISLFVFVLLFFIIYKYSNIFYLFITSFYTSFAVSMYFSSFFYVVLILLFLFILITSTITLLITKNYSYTFILFSLLIISGIDMSNFTFRFISIFSLLELYTIERKTLCKFL